jgi:hypothetical protein
VAGLAGIGAGVGLGALIRNMQEAEAATAQLDAAFKSTGDTLGITRSRLDDLAGEIQRTTTVSDDLVKEGQAILLTFDRVRGQAFERTLRVATDLSARLGTDLTQSIKQVGLALQDPIAGLTALRRSGVAPLSEEQTNLIKRLLETNQAAKAQTLILSELERRYGGSAAAARNTLGGALAGLKNSFSDLFEGTRASTAGTAKAINGLSDALSDPRIKSGIDALILSFAKLAELMVRVVSLLGRTQSKLLDLAKTAGPTATAIRTMLGQLPFLGPLAFAAEAAANAPDIRTRGPTGVARGRGNRPGIDAGGAVAELEEIRVTVRKLVDENGDLMRELNEQTRTAVQKQAAEYTKLKETLVFLRDQQLITSREFNERLGDALDELLPEFDLNEIRAKYITLKRETDELGEFMKGVWQGVGQSIQATLSDAIYEWKLSWKSLVDIARRALADIASAIITSGIQKLLKQQLGAGGGSGDQSILADSFFAFLGSGTTKGAAGGGRISGVTKVGEEGPELLFGNGFVMNQRQMAFAGMGGAKVNYAPTFNLVIQSNGDKESERRMAEYVETRIAQSQGEFARIMQRSGVEVRG